MYDPVAEDPDKWRDRLATQLFARRPEIELLERYYCGDHPLTGSMTKAQRSYRRLLKQARSNWMGLVVDAVDERLRVDGFRFGDQPGGDSVAWRIWQANQLDADSGLAHNTALVTGSAYALVWAGADGPAISIEHPSQVIVAYEPGSRRVRVAALKVWIDHDRFCWAYLYGRSGIWKYRSRNPFTGVSMAITRLPEMVPWQAGAESWPLPNPLGVVPVVELAANPNLLGGGRSELDGVTDIQDRINETLFNRLLAAQFAAFRQRWVTGMEIPTDEAGNPVEPFNAAVDRLWMAEDPGVKFGEFNESDLAGYIKSVEADIQHLAAITRTPPHYLLGQSGAFPSGDSLKATETGLVAKVRNHQLHFGEAWEEIIGLALRVAGDPRSADPAGEIIWHDPESRSQGELVDALVKMATLGVPREALWERWGASPQEIGRWKALQAQQDLLGAFMAPTATPPTPPVPVPPV